MALPLDTLLDFNGNSYEIIVAVMKRAQQITDIRVAFDPTTLEDRDGNVPLAQKNPDSIPHDEKAVAVAFSEIFNESVLYKIKSD